MMEKRRGCHMMIHPGITLHNACRVNLSMLKVNIWVISPTPLPLFYSVLLAITPIVIILYPLTLSLTKPHQVILWFIIKACKGQDIRVLSGRRIRLKDQLMMMMIISRPFCGWQRILFTEKFTSEVARDVNRSLEAWKERSKCLICHFYQATSPVLEDYLSDKNIDQAW